MKGALTTEEINLCPLCLVILKSVCHSIGDTLAAIQLAVSCSELYFARCCALKRTGTSASESKVTCFLFLTDFEK